MKDLRLLHSVAAVLNGFALAGALYAPRVGIVCCTLSALLLIWSGEKLRFAFITRHSVERSHP